MKGFSKEPLTLFVSAVTLLWVGWGVYLFLTRNWSLGEPGDFAAGAAFFIIVYTTILQYRQLRKQERDSFEQGIFRTFEVFKPEAEGLAAQIVSKLIKTGKVAPRPASPFDVMLDKFERDRTVFLREMRKSPYIEALNHLKNPDKNTADELEGACSRFIRIGESIDTSLERLREYGGDDDDFAGAIEATEVYRTYNECLKSPKVKERPRCAVHR